MMGEITVKMCWSSRKSLRMDPGEPLMLTHDSGRVFVEERVRGEAVSKAMPAHWYFQLLLTRLSSLPEPRVGHSPLSCLHSRKITVQCPGDGEPWQQEQLPRPPWSGHFPWAGSISAQEELPCSSASRLMERTHLGSQEKMPFSCLSFLF